MMYDVIIGLEIHAQLKTKTKAFCACSTEFGNYPNSHVCPVCLGMPGALPTLNRKVVEFAIMTGLALNCQINQKSVFARKNYFYPDMPKNYQISQYELPICSNGYIKLNLEGKEKIIRINRIHLEEDAGKLVHQGSATIAGATGSLVDLNRASTPLMEIVTEPDINSALEAKIYLQTIRATLRLLNVCDGNLEEGSLRCDANISLKPKNQKEFGTRTELKNMNSFRNIERAILAEIERQKIILNQGQKIIQQTRHYDEKTNQTIPLRSKEEANDYRYFPDPDLPPLILTKNYIQSIKDNLPETFLEKIQRYEKQLNLNHQEISQLTEDIDINNYFETCIKLSKNIPANQIAKWIIGDLKTLIKEENLSFANLKIKPQILIELISKVQNKSLSNSMAKKLLPKLQTSNYSLDELLLNSGGEQISEQKELEKMVENVLNTNQDIVIKIKSGKMEAINFLMGKIMKESAGRANPDIVRQMIRDKILN